MQCLPCGVGHVSRANKAIGYVPCELAGQAQPLNLRDPRRRGVLRPQLRYALGAAKLAVNGDDVLIADRAAAIGAQPCREAPARARLLRDLHTAAVDVLEDRLAVFAHVATGLELGDVGGPALLTLNGLDRHQS
jgi:hypothetical protein